MRGGSVSSLYSLAHPLGSDSFMEINTNLISSAKIKQNFISSKYFSKKNQVSLIF